MTSIQTKNHLFLQTSKGLEIIDLKALVRIEAISNYCKLYFANDKTLVVAKILAWFEEQLPAHNFARVHRSHIINLTHVQSYQRHSSRVILHNNTIIEISRRRRSELLKTFRSLSGLSLEAAA